MSGSKKKIRISWSLIAPPRLPSDLEDEFDRGTEADARRQIVIANAAALIVTIAGLSIDAHAGVFSTAVLLKFGIQIPVFALGIVAAIFLKIPAKHIWIFGAIPFFVSVVVVSALATATEAPFTDRYVTVAGLIAFISHIALPIKFGCAAVLAIANVVAYVGIPNILDTTFETSSYSDIIAFMSLITITSLVVVHGRETVQKKNFLLTRSNNEQKIELQALVNEMTKLAHLDAMTGVGNRRSFDMCLERTWNRAIINQEWVALIIVDVDHFKLFNDAAGHAAGDECLRAVAGAISKGANIPLEMVARYGGEEFAVILASTSGRTAEAIRACVAALELPHPGLPFGSHVTVSVGNAFALPVESGSHPIDLVRAADAALYKAKRTGRNRVVIANFQDSMAA